MYSSSYPRPKADMLHRCLNELIISLMLGTVPVLVLSNSPQSLSAILDVQLAGKFFVYYDAALGLAFCISALLYRALNFGERRYQERLIGFHRLMGNLGSAFLGATRTGAGAVIGFMIVWHTFEPESMTPENVVKISASAVMLIVLSAALSLCEDIFKNPRG